MDAALRQLRKEGIEVRDEDGARLSPLGYEHTNMLGHYAFSLPDRIGRGELRPLSQAGRRGGVGGPYLLSITLLIGRCPCCGRVQASGEGIKDLTFGPPGIPEC
jgi:hypothetical protein